MCATGGWSACHSSVRGGGGDAGGSCEYSKLGGAGSKRKREGQENFEICLCQKMGLVKKKKEFGLLKVRKK